LLELCLFCGSAVFLTGNSNKNETVALFTTQVRDQLNLTLGIRPWEEEAPGGMPLFRVNLADVEVRSTKRLDLKRLDLKRLDLKRLSLKRLGLVKSLAIIFFCNCHLHQTQARGQQSIYQHSL
jgi:hypothetical protein